MASKRPPCPDPELYVWINSKEGGHWRKKRGTTKTATLNNSYTQSSNHTKISSPAAARIVRKLRPFLNGLSTGRLTARIGGKIRKALNEKGVADFSFLQGFDLQPEHPFEALVTAPLEINIRDEVLIIKIPIDKHTIKKHNRIVTNYYFEMILLHGDATADNGLRIETESSAVFAIGQEIKNGCVFNIVLPKNNWMVLLKATCIEGNELAAASRNYGMKVVAVSSE